MRPSQTGGAMKQRSMTWAFPDHLAAEVAPLSLPLARHLYRYWVHECYDLREEDEQEAQGLFLADVQEQRENVYLVMDGFVHNYQEQEGMDGFAPNHQEHEHLPHRLRYSVQWLRETLGQYTPNKQAIPPKTFNHWVSMGLVRNTRKGIPTPDSGAALCIMRMSIKGTKVLPGQISAEEPAWWCYAQEDARAETRVIPITAIPQLPPHTLLWTPWAGATWDDDNHHWLLLSKKNGSNFYGAIRFAGVESRHGQTYYRLDRKELLAWRPDFRKVLSPGPFLEDDELQGFARSALVQLAQTRIRFSFPTYQD